MKKITTSKDIRRNRTRAKIAGSVERPRLNVFASNKHIFAQIIDDENGKTLAQASDAEKEFKTKGNKTEVAFEVGKTISKRAKEKKIESVVFDKGHKAYHGRVRSLAEGARDGGLNF